MHGTRRRCQVVWGMPKSVGHPDWSHYAELVFRTVQAVNS